MGKKKNSKAKAYAMESYMFPWLHRNVSTAVSGSIPRIWFNNNDTDQDSNNEYSTNVMGSFTCSNDSCSSRGWYSKMVAIHIRRYPGNGYNAVVFSQRCDSCKELGQLKLDRESYVERISYRLKVWAGVPVEKPYYNGKKGLPHKSELCEGCKRGYCEGNTRVRAAAQTAFSRRPARG